MRRYPELVKIARAYFKGCRGSHGWDHVERVRRLCERIGRKEKADLEILMPAAILHDIGRKREDDTRGRLCHATLGARDAAAILAARGYGEKEQRRIVSCIRAHRFRGRKKPMSLEAKVLYDADKLDSLGAVGVGRAFLFAGEVGARLVNTERIADTRSYSREDTAYREYMVKLRGLPASMCTRTGRIIARRRAKVMRVFFKRFIRETK